MVQVHRVENRDLWKRYAEARYAMRKKRPHTCTDAELRGVILTARDLAAPLNSGLQKEVNETLLWHGTSPEAALNIIKNTGFQLSRAGANAGTMYGAGHYFAECSSKSDEYAKDDAEGMSKGQFCFLLCRVVLGEQLIMTTGGSAVHTIIAEALKSGQYDSIVGDREASVGTYREFVVYDDALVYPEYVVLYKRVM